MEEVKIAICGASHQVGGGCCQSSGAIKILPLKTHDRIHFDLAFWWERAGELCRMVAVFIYCFVCNYLI
jgi:hypothetical protein